MKEADLIEKIKCSESIVGDNPQRYEESVRVDVMSEAKGSEDDYTPNLVKKSKIISTKAIKLKVK